MVVWKKIPGYPGYSASSLGQIRNDKTGHVTFGGNAGRYLKVSAYKEGSRVPSLVYVHDLVCRAFWGLPKIGQIVLHGDNDKKNNVPTNVKWGTVSQNTADAWRDGLIKRRPVVLAMPT